MVATPSEALKAAPSPHPIPLPVGARATGWTSATRDPLGGAITLPFSPPGRRCP
jgi:hypothetical protein